MNKKLVLAFLSSPSVLSSLLLMVGSAKAAERLPQAGTPAIPQVCSHKRCVSAAQLTFINRTPLREVVFEKPTEVAYAQPDAEYPMTEEESNVAIALFGCDCTNCINALRQLRGQPPYL